MISWFCLAEECGDVYLMELGWGEGYAGNNPSMSKKEKRKKVNVGGEEKIDVGKSHVLKSV